MSICTVWHRRKRVALEMDGEIVIDSESDNPSAYLKSTQDKKLIAKVAVIKQQVHQK